MPLYNSASLLTILNTQEELAAFPIEGKISLLFSNQIDEQNIQSYIFLVRAKPISLPLNISMTRVKHIGDINTEYYEIVPYTWVGATSTDPLNPGYVYTIAPTQPFITSVDYFIIVSESVAPLYYNVAKTNSLGPSSIGLTIDPLKTVTDLPTNTNTVFILTITQTSVIGNGAHFISYTLTKNGTPVVTNQQIEINSQVLTIDTGVTVAFNPNIPYIQNEAFTINLLGFTRPGTTQIQAITTNITNDVIQPTPEQQSVLLTQQNIIDFYDKYGFSRRLGNPSTIPAPGDPTLTPTEVQSGVCFRYRFPNQIFCELDYEIDPASLSADAFSIRIGPAFDNAFLGNIGNYQNVTDYIPTTKWVITYGVVPDDEGVDRIVRLTIGQDTTGLVTGSNMFVVLPDGAVMGPNTTGNVRMHVTLLGNVIQTADDTKTLVFNKKAAHDFEDMLLMPLYALPNDITYFFFQEHTKQYDHQLYRILFEGSLEADSIVTPFVQSTYGMSPQTMFYVKRRYVIAWATYYFALLFYRDFLKAIKKSKFLADLKVSLDIEKDPEFIKALMNDAKTLMDAIKTGLNAPYNMQSFVKGAANPHNKTTARLWMPSLGNNFPDISMATTKSGFMGKLYKIGDQFQHLYPNFYNRSAGIYSQYFYNTNF